jgi:mycothiol synthase
LQTHVKAVRLRSRPVFCGTPTERYSFSGLLAARRASLYGGNVSSHAGSPDLSISVTSTLDPEWISPILELVENATKADGVAPLNEQVMLDLRAGALSASHVLALEAGTDRLVGYAFVDRGHRTQDATAELVVHPDTRGRGIGRQLVTAAAKVAHQARLRMWAHGGLPGAAALASHLGFISVRELWQMRRSLDLPLPEVAPPGGITIRSFQPGADESRWLAVNARAFADHPEQGAITRADLEARMAEPWFDAAGFFLAERSGDLVGFHWTKVHGTGADAIGEVYVLGVDPSAQRVGLGTTLTLIGLQHLVSLGLSTVMLYVESDNAAGIKMYERLGFVHHSTDVMYLREP